MQRLMQPQLNDNALTVLERRYLKKDADGNPIETPEQMFWRVAVDIATADRNYNPAVDVEGIALTFYELMASLDFLPNSPTLMNAGRDLQQLSACFVLPIADTMESIFTAIKNTALIHQSGGGTGFSFSRIRPKNDRVASTGGIASGPVSFMKVFNSATEAVKQGGTRRGANMAILKVDHPDILEFITCKQDPAVLTNFNISVGITEDFMRAVEQGDDYQLINPRTGQSVRTVSARHVFDLIVDMAWRNGEPGVVFLDRINRDNPTPALGEIESTNPCGEQPLLPYESCNLGSINLEHMVKDTPSGPEIDYAHLGDVITRAVHFLDNVIDQNRYPLPEIEHMTKGNRKIGLGIMGFADMLIRLGVPYNVEEALRIAEQLMEFIHEKARAASIALARERGPFPNSEQSIYAGAQAPIRNATVTTIAPTGTLSIIAGCSGGIEPLFGVVFTRNILDGQRLLEVHPLFERIAKERGFYSEALMEKISQHKTIQELADIPEEVRRLFVTAYDVPPEWHVRMQAAFQKHTDNAVSKTVNFRQEATPEDIRSVYMLAYRLGCKGVTVYRDASRQEQVLTAGKQDNPASEPATRAGQHITPRPRPQVTSGATYKTKTGCGNLYITINEDEHGLCEVFTSMGKQGGCMASQAEAVSRLISLTLRSGVAPESIIQQLKGIRCPNLSWENGGKVLSCADAIAKAIERHRIGGAGGNSADAHTEMSDLLGLCPQCPECGGTVEIREGCLVCRSCGYSKCP
jgi:ribonucleoside-diphosphate reductase alpha chain